MAEGRVYRQHTVAVPDERWDAFGEFADAMGTDRSKLINRYMAWCCREPGVTLPRRPVMPPPEHPNGTTT